MLQLIYAVITLFAYIVMAACVLFLCWINYLVADELSRMPRLSWRAYMQDATRGCEIEWIIIFLCIWPGLFIGDLGKKFPKETEEQE